MGSPRPSQDSFKVEPYEQVDPYETSQIRGRDVIRGAGEEGDTRRQTQTRPENLDSRQSVSQQGADDMPEFEYKPLEHVPNRPSIRLVTLQPGQHDDMIKVELTHTALAENPRYEALSYTWGDIQNQECVHVDGKRFSIRRDLYRALKHFRHETETCVLWIDAICINQEDNVEKSWQVKLMADIYRRAWLVLVWLGFIDNFDPPDRLPLSSGNQYISDLELDHLCDRPYWGRLWIVQEVCAAVDIDIHWEVRLKTGNTRIPRSVNWETFFEDLLDSRNPSDAVKLARQRECRYKGTFLLPSLIQSSSFRLCERPHDKIYGFVGIAQDCEDGGFPVDYEKSLWELYEDTIRFFYNSVDFDGPKMIMGFSHLVSEVLGDPPAFKHVHSEDCAQCNGHIEDGGYLFEVEGVNGGEVSILGPTYDELTANPPTVRAWNLEVRRRTRTEGGARIRAENDKFITSLLTLEDSQMPGTAAFIDSFGWATTERHEMPALLRYCIASKVFLNDRQHWRSSDYRLFAASDGTIGLAHVSIDIGDEIFHFRDSEIAAVVRKEENEILRVIGKAFLAKQQHTEQIPGWGALDMNKTTDLYLDIVALRNLTLKPSI